MLPLVLALLLGVGPGPCARAAERDRPITPLPPTWGLQLVGVAVDREAQRVATIRQGDQRNALSAVRRVGDKLLGRVEVVAIGWRSILVRADGNLFMLGLKGRPHRDWTDVLRRWRTCSETDAGPR